MRSELDILLEKITDPTLRADIRTHMERLQAKRTFGLVYESHLPERVRLRDHHFRAGVRVVYRDRSDSPVFQILSIKSKNAKLKLVRHPDGSRLTEQEAAAAAEETAGLNELIVIAEFGEPVFPGLEHLGSVARGGDKPAHVVIKGENHHVLEALQFTHSGKIDCIYIDPPYNSGARDWKYDNDYVDESDVYRHSKWLAFMERRLWLAKRLLNPRDSVFIVAIDEKEYLRLGLLLDQIFYGATVQMVSTLTNPALVPRPGSFGRSDEYVFFVTLGNGAPQRVQLSREWVSSKGRTHTGNIRWDLLRRSGEGAARQDSPGCFYPIYIDPDGPRVAQVGEPLPEGESTPSKIEGCVAVLPIRKNGQEGRWQWTPTTFRERKEQGRVQITGSKKKGYVVSILKDGEFAKIENGEFEIIGRNPDGSLILDDIDTSTVLAVPGSQWRISSHDATQYGSRLGSV